MFKVYDAVWVMDNNEPVKKLVFAVVESMSSFKVGTETYYLLVDSRLGAGWGNNSGIRRTSNEMFATKELLIQSL